MSRKPVSYRAGDVNRPAEPFVWLSAELLRSEAWRTKSVNCSRLIEYLFIEHMQHGGQENGRLAAPYDALVEFGIGRRLIGETIGEAERLGLISVDRGRPRGARRNKPNRYRLTFYATADRDEDGFTVWHAPTDDWKRFKEPPKNHSESARR